MISSTDPSSCHRRHLFGADTAKAERRTHLVIGITTAMMAAEIAAGTAFGSMALLADGWHMSTHVAAFLIAAFAYAFSRRHAANPVFSFGTGKVGVLGGFASAVVLFVVAVLMAVESAHRMLAPVPIRFDEAIGVAALGLAVNVVCALLLRQCPHVHAGHPHHSGGGKHGHDVNLRSAYVHVVADALTSVTAIAALVAGRFWGWGWLDPVMGIVGGGVICVWAVSLLRETSLILLDRTPASSDLPRLIRQAVESDGDAQVTDLHVWQVAEGRFAAIVSVSARHPCAPELYHNRLKEHGELIHLSVEVVLSKT